MKSYMLSALLKQFAQSTAEELRAEFPHSVLIWEPKRWAPQEVGTRTAKVSSLESKQPLTRGGESLVLGIAPRADGRELVLGRGTDCDICLGEQTVSTRHMSFRFEQGWSVCDLHSKNGTSVDGHRLIAGLHTPLEQGTTITAGDVLLRFYSPDGLAQRLAEELRGRAAAR
ncbi:MAG: FHA domain-containing protein [Archangiaceae bacterium]|nr:FHA domain-containing protein [Archangiaceae bacterium]